MGTVLAGLVLQACLSVTLSYHNPKKQSKRLMSDPENAGGEFSSKKNEP